MADAEYDRLSTDLIPFETRNGSSESHKDSESDSDVSYRDNLEAEPFDEKDRRFQEEPNMEDGDGQGYPVEPRRLRPRKKSRKVLAILISIMGFAAIIGGLAAAGYSAPSFSRKSGNKHMTLDHVMNGTFAVRNADLSWVKEAPDGTFSNIKDGNIVLNTVRNITQDVPLVDSSDVLDTSGNRLQWQAWAVSADMEYVLFKTDHVKQWRYSSFGNYWVHRRSDRVTFPVIPPRTPPTINRCTWSPVSHSLAFVSSNDLYVIPASEMATSSPQAIRVTADGSTVVFNGVPDWVYEEEVLAGDSAAWWSPDGQTIAFLRSDETAVRDYKLEYYNPSNDAFEPHPYFTELDMKYPKPGTPNPLVLVQTFSLGKYLSNLDLPEAKQTLSWPGEMSQDRRVIIEVGWVADDALLVKEIDRAARVGNVALFQGGNSLGTVVRTMGKDGEEGDNGWIDHGQNVVPVKDGLLPGYLDLVPNEGYNHIAFFSPLNSTRPIWITSGQWEVTTISGIDTNSGTVYFMAARPSIDRHLYAAYLPTHMTSGDYKENSIALTNTDLPGFYETHFSPGMKHYVLSYKGPDVPWTRLLQVEDEDGEDVDVLLEGNNELNLTLSEYVRPLISRTTIENDGYEMNMLEILPPNIDTSGRKKYPVLIRVYGGPGSQTVSSRFERDWHSFLACERKYIVVMLDGRGTGFRGRPLRNPVMDDLGRWEVGDQVAAAREMVKRKYVDRTRIGIWGWSYGGYMTCKTIEADSGLFTLGMAVAPVTNWLYYDSIYAERYMGTPVANPAGYVRAAVNNVTAFDKVDFLLAHGTGDDNVHFMHSASLMDKFTQQHVRGWRFRLFTDSNHNMDKREAFYELYVWMTEFLDEKWGRGGNVHHVS